MGELDEYEKAMAEEVNCRMKCFGVLFLVSVIVALGLAVYWLAS